MSSYEYIPMMPGTGTSPIVTLPASMLICNGS